MPIPIGEIPYESPIEERIAWAEHCYGEIKDQLLEDRKVGDLLKRLKHAARSSHREMAAAGVVDECRECEQREGGSCCGAGLENKYSGVLLLINLLLDVKIPQKGLDPSSCIFLGLSGCRLLARHVICVNYICSKISDHIDPGKIASLKEKEGVELELLFHLNERIRNVLKAQN